MTVRLKSATKTYYYNYSEVNVLVDELHLVINEAIARQETTSVSGMAPDHHHAEVNGCVNELRELQKIVDKVITHRKGTSEHIDLDSLLKTFLDTVDCMAEDGCAEYLLPQIENEGQTRKLVDTVSSTSPHNFEWWDVTNLFDTADPIITDSVQDVVTLSKL
jgi:hypothetical protein